MEGYLLHMKSESGRKMMIMTTTPNLGQTSGHTRQHHMFLRLKASPIGRNAGPASERRRCKEPTPSGSDWWKKSDKTPFYHASINLKRLDTTLRKPLLCGRMGTLGKEISYIRSIRYAPTHLPDAPRSTSRSTTPHSMDMSVYNDNRIAM